MDLKQTIHQPKTSPHAFYKTSKTMMGSATTQLGQHISGSKWMEASSHAYREGQMSLCFGCKKRLGLDIVM